MKILQRKSGITLIALVITIVVLIILVAVAINLIHETAFKAKRVLLSWISSNAAVHEFECLGYN